MLRTGLGFPPADKGVVPIVERNDMQASTVQAVDSLGQYSEVGPSFLPEPVFRAQQFGNEKEGQFDDATEESSAQFDDADEFSSGGPQVNRNSFPARPQIVCSSGLPADHTRKRGANTLKPVVAPDDSFGASDASTDTEEGRFDSKQETRAIGEASASREEIGCNDVLCGPEGSKYLHPGYVLCRFQPFVVVTSPNISQTICYCFPKECVLPQTSSYQTGAIPSSRRERQDRHRKIRSRCCERSNSTG
jgi:hypothetical protein